METGWKLVWIAGVGGLLLAGGRILAYNYFVPPAPSSSQGVQALPSSSPPVTPSSSPAVSFSTPTGSPSTSPSSNSGSPSVSVSSSPSGNSALLGTFPSGLKSSLPSPAQNLFTFPLQRHQGQDIFDLVLQMQGLTLWQGSNRFPGTVVVKQGTDGAFRVDWEVPPGLLIKKSTWYDFRISSEGNDLWPENWNADSIMAY